MTLRWLSLVFWMSPSRDAQVLARGQAHDLGGGGGLLHPALGRPARAQLAARKVDDAGPVALVGEEAHRAAGAQLDVVGVGGEREHVERLAVGVGVAVGVGHRGVAWGSGQRPSVRDDSRDRTRTAARPQARPPPCTPASVAALGPEPVEAGDLGLAEPAAPPAP